MKCYEFVCIQEVLQYYTFTRLQLLTSYHINDIAPFYRTCCPITLTAYKKFVENVHKLERHFKDMQDVEFTVENGKLWMLQCRNGKRTGPAAIRIAIELQNEGICTKDEAILRVEPNHVKQLLHPHFTPEALASKEYTENVFAKGLAGGPGAAVGKLVFSTKKAEEAKEKGESVILVRVNTSPEDVGGMWASSGILTSKGGKTSHAAVVARGWGKPCVCGAHGLDVFEAEEEVTVKATEQTFKAGDIISLNGSTGECVSGAIDMKAPISRRRLGCCPTVVR